MTPTEHHALPLFPPNDVQPGEPREGGDTPPDEETRGILAQRALVRHSSRHALHVCPNPDHDPDRSYARGGEITGPPEPFKFDRNCSYITADQVSSLGPGLVKFLNAPS